MRDPQILKGLFALTFVMGMELCFGFLFSALLMGCQLCAIAARCVTAGGCYLGVITWCSVSASLMASIVEEIAMFRLLLGYDSEMPSCSLDRALRQGFSDHTEPSLPQFDSSNDVLC